MKRYLIAFFMMLVCAISTNAQNWSERELAKNPFTQKSINEYVYNFNGTETNYGLRISPIFNNMIMIETNEPIGRFRINRFNHTITSKVTVFLYDRYGRKTWRNRETVGLGLLNTNEGRKFASLKCDKLYNHLLNEDGYAVIYYTSLVTGEDTAMIIPCINNTEN